MAEADDVNKRVDAELTKAEAEMRLFDKKHEADVIYKRVKTVDADGLKGLGKNLKTSFSEAGKNTKKLISDKFAGMKESVASVTGALGPILPLLAGILAAVGGIAAVWAIAWYTDPVQKAARKVDGLSNACDKAAASVDNLQKSLSGLKSSHETLE
jgi:hypothetical protein